MWQDHPIVGVGLGGFIDNASDYVRAVGPLQFANFIAEQPHVVHNSYLEMLAETGIVGLGLYLAVVAACLRCAWRAAKRFEQAGDAAMAVLSRAVIVSVLSMLTAAFFISGETDRRAWVLLAFGPALLAATRSEAASEAAVGAGSRRSRRPWHGPPRPLHALHYENATSPDPEPTP
jgi:O-antigen ligase